MKVLLMHRDRDFDPRQAAAPNERALREDLGLDALLSAMAGEDEFLLKVARAALLAQARCDRDTILRRQAVLGDCLRNPRTVRALYGLASEAFETRRQRYFYGYLGRYPGGILSGAVGLMDMLIEILRRLRNVGTAAATQFESTGFRALFSMLEEELSEAYLRRVEEHLRALRFKHGLLLSARVDPDAGPGIDHVLRKPNDPGGGWLQRLLRVRPPGHSFRLHGRDEAGARILSDLRNRGLNLVANALAQSAEHVLSFFEALRAELGFYVACMNLHARLHELGLAQCFPEPWTPGGRTLRFTGLRDPGMALYMGASPVGNTVDADGAALAVVTGPNQGGKSSFLRSVGAAQLMMDCGMFVAAESFSGEISSGVFTHYKREEDEKLNSGKFDEELGRLSAIVDQIGPNALVLFNESFAATNEREGSEVSRQIVSALLEKGIRIVFVTHQYPFARSFVGRAADDVRFLRAERLADGSRTFRIVEGEPLETSYGEDVCREVFGPEEERPDTPAMREPLRAAGYNRRA